MLLSGKIARNPSRIGSPLDEMASAPTTIRVEDEHEEAVTRG
jgi:hypothetical protein